MVFVPLAAIRNPAFVASAIAEASRTCRTSRRSICRSARAAACGDRPTLLVLDNFEQVLDAAPLVADLLTSVASLRLLATSRAPLRVRGEREYTVGPLALEAASDAASPADLARVSRGAAVRGTRSGRAARLSPHVGERPDGDGDLPTARCAAARPRAGGPVDQSADRRGSAPPARARCPALDRRARAISPSASRR